jgi:hypothetical protein
MFQDEITLLQANGDNVELERTGIAWDSDKKFKFKNPPDWDKPAFKDKYAKPKGIATEIDLMKDYSSELDLKPLILDPE